MPRPHALARDHVETSGTFVTRDLGIVCVILNGARLPIGRTIASKLAERISTVSRPMVAVSAFFAVFAKFQAPAAKVLAKAGASADRLLLLVLLSRKAVIPIPPA
jgi:hypothetical protein